MLTTESIIDNTIALIIRQNAAAYQYAKENYPLTTAEIMEINKRLDLLEESLAGCKLLVADLKQENQLLAE